MPEERGDDDAGIDPKVSTKDANISSQIKGVRYEYYRE